MESLVKEKDDSISTSEALENDVKDFVNKAKEYDKNISEKEKMISNLEIQLDDTMTKTIQKNEKLEVASKTASDSELEVSALVRRVQLLDEETTRVNERLIEVLDKLKIVEKTAEDNERAVKILEARSFQNEEKTELQETQLHEAQQIAEDADRKFEEVSRKLRMVENELERVVDRAEEFEGKASTTEIQLDGDRNKLKELEELAGRNGEQEDKLEDQVRKLTEEVVNADTRAEFAEKTVEKLEATIDAHLESLSLEKGSFVELSKALDETLTDMMTVSKS